MALAVAILLAIFVLPAPWGLAAVGIGALVEIVEAGALIWYSKRRRSSVGVATLVGERAVVVDHAYVRVSGELWRADGLEGTEPGETVTVVAVDGLRLTVE
jgi:membrane protein implicated in regulation of membrane protease activity